MTETLSKKEVAERATMREVRKRLEEKEFIARCNAVKMCYKCGNDWVDTEGLNSHHTTLACPNTKCSEFHVTKKHIYPDGKEA